MFIDGEWVEREAEKIEIKADDIPIRGLRANIAIDDLWQLSEDNMEILKSLLFKSEKENNIKLDEIYLSDAVPHWIAHNEGNPFAFYGECSECGFIQSVSNKWNYCPECGVRMIK